MIKKFILILSFFIFYLFFSAKAETNSKIEALKFEIVTGIKNFSILQHLNNLSKSDRVIIAENRRYLGANLIYDEKIIPISIRQDGLGEEHFDNQYMNQNTYKIRMKNEKYFKNMKEFRIVSPDSVRHDIPIYANKLLDKLNIPNPKQILAKIDLNQDRMNKSVIKKQEYTHIIEESIKDDFLDRNYLREGVLFKRDIFNSEGMKILQECRKKVLNKEDCDLKLKERINNAKIKQINKFKNKDQINHAFGIFNQYLLGLKTPNEVINYETTIDLFIFHSIWNNGHSLQDHNIKFYYDPISKLITPIPSDFFHPMPFYADSSEVQSNDKLIIPFKIENWEFAAEIEHFFKYNNGAENWFDNLIADSNFQMNYFSRLQELLIDKDKIKDLRSVNFEVFSETNNYYGYIKGEGEDEITFVNIFNNNLTSMIEFVGNVKFQKIINKQFNKFKKELSLQKQSFKNKYLNINHEKKIITLKNKKTLIDEDVVIPQLFQDYEFQINNGEELLLDNNAKLVVKSKFSCKNMAKISSIHTSDSYLLFQGKKSVVNNCSFRNFYTRNNFVTGAITFYRTNLEIKNSHFENFDAEDMLNIVFSNFRILNTKFNNSTSDLIDIDVGKGSLNKIEITNCGNDCLDFSGSIVEANNIRINKSLDKGISVGEESFLKINKLHISNCGAMCIAVKDSSHLDISDSLFSTGKIGIASYIKKGIYNMPSTEIKNLQFKNIQTDIDKNSNFGL